MWLKNAIESSEDSKYVKNCIICSEFGAFSTTDNRDNLIGLKPSASGTKSLTIKTERFFCHLPSMEPVLSLSTQLKINYAEV